ncbi:Response regulator receiver domain-containing protein [Halogranum amylolyticum]|uniref:Response regulator receiver domain-containing protein n=1 Tax=Halogranum amylolyticum TaxID=660520 RepID=A0A1H8NJ42_9EURY|nr:HalOD1 output domain-containing protein [Halogranum amylolyticum]SEO29509.1 Response regulator receiver domain-containing protein [Halogranum amylolyticum]
MTAQCTVLHVDDDPEFLELSEQLFDREASFDTLTAPTAEDGLRLLRTHEVDCVVSDFVVSADGTPFISAARDVDVDVPIILFTGKEWDLVAADAVTANVTHYVQKAGVEEIELVKSRARQVTEAGRDASGTVVGDPPTSTAPVTATSSFEAAATRLGEEWVVVGRHDWSDAEELGTTVLEALETLDGRRTGTDVPLFETIDADALADLLGPTPSGHERPGVQVRFPYGGHELAVTSDGDVAIRPL